MEEVEIVEVHRDDFLLRVVPLQLDGNHPLDGLLHGAFVDVVGLGAIELLGQLLRDGAAAAGLLLAHDHALHHSTKHGAEVDAAVLVEAFVLGGHKGLHEVGGEVFVAYVDAVGTAVAPRAQQDSVGGIDLACILIYRVLQLLQVGHVTYDAAVNQREQAHYQ